MNNNVVIEYRILNLNRDHTFVTNYNFTGAIYVKVWILKTYSIYDKYMYSKSSILNNKAT